MLFKWLLLNHNAQINYLVFLSDMIDVSSTILQRKLHFRGNLHICFIIAMVQVMDEHL